jgi:hypothetical protein
MSIVPRKPIRRPTVFKPARPLEKAVFKTIVEMAYEMNKAHEQESASNVFSSLMRHAFGLAIESDWKINPAVVLSDILYDGVEAVGHWKDGLWGEDECELLFRYFVWKRGIKTVRSVLKDSYQPPAGSHLLYSYRGKHYCKIDICYNLLNRYVEDKM